MLELLLDFKTTTRSVDVNLQGMAASRPLCRDVEAEAGSGSGGSG